MSRNCKHAPCEFLTQVGEHFICKKDSLIKDRYPTVSTIRSYDITCNDFKLLENDNERDTK